MSTCSPVMVAAVAVPPCGQSVHAPSGCSRLAQLVAGEHRAAGRLRRPPSAPPGSCTSPPRPKRSRPWEARASSPKKRRFPCRAVRMQPHHPGDAPPHVEPWSSECATPRHRRAGSWRGAHRPPGAGRADHRRYRRPAPRPRSRPLGSLTPSTGSSPRHVAARRGPRRTPPTARRDAGQNPVPFHDRRRYTEPAGQSSSAHGGGSTYSGKLRRADHAAQPPGVQIEPRRGLHRLHDVKRLGRARHRSRRRHAT